MSSEDAETERRVVLSVLKRHKDETESFLRSAKGKPEMHKYIPAHTAVLDEIDLIIKQINDIPFPESDPVPQETRGQRKERLERELNEIKAEEAAEELASLKKRREILLGCLPSLIALHPTHVGRDCDDQHLVNRDGDCPRCILLDIDKEKSWRKWREDVEVEISIVYTK